VKMRERVVALAAMTSSSSTGSSFSADSSKPVPLAVGSPHNDSVGTQKALLEVSLSLLKRGLWLVKFDQIPEETGRWKRHKWKCMWFDIDG